MTKKQFKEALLRGQGRCIKAVQTKPEKYKSVILWACGHEVAFDAQCEGTRAWFVYQMICCYEDKAPFLQRAIVSIDSVKSDGGWKMLYLAELLQYFAEDGEKSATDALWRKYEELRMALMNKKCLPKNIFPQRDDFEMLCEVLCNNKNAMLKVAEDIGQLYKTNTLYDGWDFEWLFDSKAKRYRKTLENAARKSENIAEYLRVSQVFEEECKNTSNVEQSLSGRRLSRWLKHNADDATIQVYVQRYLNEKNPQLRATALEAFGTCTFPDNPLPIIEDTQSDCEQLRESAWEALGNIRHPQVRQFALENLKSDVENVFSAFIINYYNSDETLLSEVVKSVEVDWKCTTSWHGIQMGVLGMADRGMKAPADVLLYIYNSTYCSCCREHALRQMGRRRLLTTEILEECLFDSNSDIRSYAKQYLKRKI